MLALYRAGRHAEALGVYRDGHRVLREELGLEPSATLRNLELAILARDPALHAECLAPPGAPEPPAGAPKQLPPAIDDFTGRDKELAWIWQLLGKDQPRAGDGPAVVAITGLAGVGKTALAVRAAHSLRSQFPDGQLFVNLRGAELRAAEPADVLAGFLRALGVDGSSIPEGLEERAQLYRTRLADRHVLVVLDNAGDEAQVRPLLPGGTDCATLVTSRTPLVALEAAHALALQILPDEQAIELLGRLLGPVRVAAEPAASRVIVQRCGGLPLALRVVGARGAARPELRLGTLADRLADERRRLHELRVGDLEVRASLALSYASQDGDGRRAFRLLALAPAVTSAAWVAAALLDVPLNAAEEQVERLVDAALVEVAGYDAAGQIRYRMHDLLRLFARERLEDEEPAGSRSRALDRLLTACVELACYADALLQPGRRQHDPTRGGWPAHAAVVAPLEADPAAWLTAERAALVGAVRQAHAGGRWRLAWGLADGLCGFLEMRSHWDQWRQVLELALDGARRAGDGDAETQALCGLGELAYDQGNLEQAEQLLKAALERAQTHRDRRATAHALVVLSDVCRDDERLEETVVHLAEAAPIIFQLSDRRAEACALRSMALACRDLGHLEESVTCFEHCVEVFGQLGDRRWTAYARRLLAEVHRYRGDLTKATRCAELSLAELRELGDQRAASPTRNATTRSAWRPSGSSGTGVPTHTRCAAWVSCTWLPASSSVRGTTSSRP